MKLIVSKEFTASLVNTHELKSGNVYRIGKLVIIPDSDSGGLVIDTSDSTFMCTEDIQEYLSGYHQIYQVQLTPEKVSMTIS